MQVADDLDAPRALPVGVLEIDVLDQKEAAFHPLVGHRPLHIPGHRPRPDQSIQRLEVGVWLRGLLTRLGVRRVCHRDYSFR